MYDPLLTLHPGANSILNRTLVIRQGDASEDVCATVEGTDMHSLRPGLIPCVMKQYADCLVGTEKQDVCVYRACMGWERVWGKVEDGVLLCTQVFERFPKVLGRGGKGGKVKCRHGVYGLLKHSDAHARTL